VTGRNTETQPHRFDCGRTRREFLWELGGGFTGLALIDLLSRDGFFSQCAGASESTRLVNPLTPKTPHFAARAKRVIYFFMAGGPSHVDTFDPKPALTKFEGTSYRGPLKVGSNCGNIGKLMQSQFSFRKHGQGGLEISSIYPHLARHADDLCVIRSMHTDTAAHGAGHLQMNTGSPVVGRPCLGSWVTYGLGSESEDLPSFVVMTDQRGGPPASASNWSAGYMPAAYQGTLFRSKGTPLLNLATPKGTSEHTQRHVLDLLGRFNQQHLDSRPGESELVGRIHSYELAYRMQTAAAEVVDVQSVGARTRSDYGLDNNRTAEFGRRCLIASRLLERGVRFIQLYHGGGTMTTTWDTHRDNFGRHKRYAGETDQPIAALIQDLKNSGLWEDTLLIWGGEFGRTPTSEGGGGRDHNHYGFSTWLAGGGIRGGRAVGATDELGFEAVERPCHVSELHATILHLMGLDHELLTYFYGGADQRLTGVQPQEVIHEVLA